MECVLPLSATCAEAIRVPGIYPTTGRRPTLRSDPTPSWKRVCARRIEFGHDATRCYVRFSPPGGENVFVAPFSVSTCLAMILLGANQDTASQLASALHFTA